MPPTSATGSPQAPTGPRPGPRRAGTAGFTLVEVLVALSLVAVAGLALVEFQGIQLRSASALTATTLARIEADNQAIRLLLAPAAPAGPTASPSVNGGIPFRVETVPGPSPSPEAFPGLVTLDIRVSPAEGGPVLARREVIRPR
ncbi:MAG: type II secretion system protein [Thermaurantiacus tibetensis]|uniref:type II secretion system protein n=1 Tax=Thermaurantiacus tibetensis TaxID=2759035 RepID=UPI0018903D7B|nr:type II secretion system protein [Thermaurantiacus tibetensis]